MQEHFGVSTALLDHMQEHFGVSTSLLNLLIACECMHACKPPSVVENLSGQDYAHARLARHPLLSLSLDLPVTWWLKVKLS
jgi:hypothetical protein